MRRLAQVLAGIIDGDVCLAGESQASDQELGIIYPCAVELKLGPLGVDSAIQLGGVGAAIDIGFLGVPAPLVKQHAVERTRRIIQAGQIDRPRISAGAAIDRDTAEGRIAGCRRRAGAVGRIRRASGWIIVASGHIKHHASAGYSTVAGDTEISAFDDVNSGREIIIGILNLKGIVNARQ